MNSEIESILEKFKEVKNILIKFDNKEQAVQFLVKETKLSKEECSIAYDIIIKINVKK